ncbi:MAG: ester cyclase [Pseudomonadota bacterium]
MTSLKFLSNYWSSIGGLMVLIATLLAVSSARAADISGEKALSKQAVEMWAADAEIDTGIFAEEYVNHQAPLATGGTGTIDLATWASVVERSHSAFPDLTVEILDQIAESDRVSTYWRFSGTQTGAYLGLDPTGKQVDWTGVQIDRHADGKIAESWVVWDYFSLRSELGEESSN